ncbi:MAG: NFACT RNA binding domain-containing protein [Candidatus Krumholzibacteriia bacterium]
MKEPGESIGSERPWRDRERLAALLRGWRRHAGRPLFRTLAGDGWVELRLAGDDRAAFFLCARPGAALLCDLTAPLPRSLQRALPPGSGPALGGHLEGATFTGAGLLPDDHVAALHLTTRAGTPVALLIQLFGSRGNLALVDPQARLLWCLHRPPHPALAAWPDESVWTSALAESEGHRGGGRVARRFRSRGLELLARRREEELAAALAARMRQARRQQQRLLANLDADLAVADSGDELRRDAENLAAHLHLWRSGLERIEVADVRDGSPRVIALDPARDAAANLDRLFKQARRAQRGREVISARRRDAGFRLAELLEADRMLAEAVALPPARATAGGDTLALPRLEALTGWEEANAELVAAPRATQTAAAEAAAVPFRRYLLDGRWEVWVGRGSTENDELTHRHSGLRDLWFHAQGTTGSHVILRTGDRPENVPQRIKELTAAIAAHHSRARNSGIVPVIVAERRYVRRPRKSPPGTAVCLRHESLFVEPRIPTEAEPMGRSTGD